jgi:flagellar assembly protein FliH
MSPILKVDEMVAKNIQRYAPTLATFYREEKVVQLLIKAESIADQLLKDQKRIESDFFNQMEADRAQSLLDIERIREKAYQEGIKAGKEDLYGQFSELLDLLRSMKEELEDKRSTWMAEAESDMVKLSLVVAEKLVLQELSTKPEMLVTMIKTLLKKTSEQQSLTLQVNPDDLELIKKHLPELKQTLGTVKVFQAEPNPTIKRGGVIFDMDSGILDARIETQVSKLYQALVNEPN